MKKIHIDKLIQAKMKAEGRSVTWLAKQLNCDRSNIYKIYRKTTIDTALLSHICELLNFDFFQYYSSSFRP
ncbi:MAG: helix-turn-helix domain-containing protein [Tannerella sp.]|nr:helix-turn-helix domain-containing protein [Tannerella sp.]